VLSVHNVRALSILLLIVAFVVQPLPAQFAQNDRAGLSQPTTFVSANPLAGFGPGE
jgi:hypothetical protein